jgi:hypothetical protein
MFEVVVHAYNPLVKKTIAINDLEFGILFNISSLTYLREKPSIMQFSMKKLRKPAF